jgi:eukaryotic-like serine/threonine-protein kinase
VINVVDGGRGEQDVLAGRYRLLDVIGRGGMGRVWLAHDLLLDRDVAVKEVLPVAGLVETREELARRTVREARAAARLSHPNAVQVFDVQFAAGRPWIVMELVAGRSLDALVRQDGPLGVADVCRIGLALLDVLDAANRIGILHRDIKPHNVLVADNGRILLGDFGVAGAVPGAAGRPGSGRPLEEVTPAGVTMASPAYVAPERAADGSSTIETDLWSVGATLYWAIEGRPPYTRAGVMQQLTALATEPPDPVVRAGPLAPVLLGLLQQQPHHRLTVTKARRLLIAAAATPSTATTPPAATRAARPRARMPVVAAVLILAAVLGAAGAVGVAAARPVPTTMFVAGAVPVPISVAGCESAGNAAPPAAAPGAGGTALPAGWIRTGTDRFSVGVPRTWQRTASGGRLCVRASDPSRVLTAEPTQPSGGGHVAFWQREEQRMLQRGAPANYQRIAIGPLTYRGGGADWEYRYDSDGMRWHVLKRRFSAEAEQTFVVTWTTTDADWTAQQRTFTTIIDSFDAR